MKIDHCLILSAGVGSRMGEIGSALPKPLWPIYESTLLKLQILFAKTLGIPNIYINLHFQADLIKEYLEHHKLADDVICLEEKELLGIGGAIHNLARSADVSYQGNLLVLNCDQFILFDKKTIKNATKLLKKHDVVLFSTILESDSSYSEIVLNKKNELTGIVPTPHGKTNYRSYSGCSIIDLTKLDPTPGISNYFSSIAPYKKKPIVAIDTKEMTYWDFGTIPRYRQSILDIMRKTISKESDEFLDFLKTTSGIEQYKLKEAGYGPGNSDKIINFSTNQNISNNSTDYIIVLDSKNPIVADKAGIYWGDLKQIF